MTETVIVTYVLFVLTYLGLAMGRVPGLKVDRATIALAGAALMLATGMLDFEAAVRSIDYRTIVLLFGMMVVVAGLRLSGFFGLFVERLVRSFRRPYSLLATIVFLSGSLSAFLVNDVVCIAMAPLVVELCKELELDPLPYLIALATASNVGSVATITGNPQNMIIGSLSGISYLRFAMREAPISAVGLFMDYCLIAFLYRRRLEARPARQKPPSRPRVIRGLLAKSLIVTLAAIGCFFAGWPTEIVALVAAAVVLMGRVRVSRLYQAVDWTLLVLFAGLFVVVHAFDANVVRHWGLEHWHAILDSPVVAVSALSVVLSNLVSNVPAVMLFEPLMKLIPDKEQAWLALSMSSTLAGNLTILGSVANLIVVEKARKEGVEVGFVEYLKVGLPLTIVTVVLGILWLSFVRY